MPLDYYGMKMIRFLFSSIILCSILSSTIAWHNVTQKQCHNIMRRSTDINYSKILDFWRKHKNEFVLQGEINEAVLVMGNTGSGKSTLVLSLLGRKLRAIIKNGYFKIIDDEDKIGTDSSSKTLIPEIMTDDKNNIKYIDCSGFRDNRDVEHEISSIYFQNIIMNQIKYVKLVFVISYESLKDTGNKNDFDDLFEHIGSFMKNITKYHKSIAFVVTKVENLQTISADGKLILLNTDELVMNGIGDYISSKIDIYSKKTENPTKYKVFKNLLEVLVQKENNLLKKIAIFRQPNGMGLLSEIPKTKQEVDRIFKVIQNIEYTEKAKDDFGFALSKATENSIIQIVDDIYNNALTVRLYEMGNETLTHYLQMVKQYSDIERLSNRIAFAHDIISEIPKLNINEPLELFRALLDAVNRLNVSVSLTNIDMISDDIDTLRFFTTLLNDHGDIRMQSLKYKALRITEFIENLKIFYDFLADLQFNLAKYRSQKFKRDNGIKNIINLCSSSKSKVIKDISYLDNIVKEIGSETIYNKIKHLELNKYQLMHLKTVFEAFSNELKITCPKSGQMIAQGYNVKLSDVVKNTCWQQAKQIKIFALNKVFIDCILDKTGAEAQLYIFAPTWEVVGAQKIILDGKKGEPRAQEYADDAKFISENGKNGLEGNSGGAAGKFYGVGDHFINSDSLEIHANGGQGGPGQNGGKGADGIPGEELPQEFLNRVYAGVPGFADPNDILRLGYRSYVSSTSKGVFRPEGGGDTYTSDTCTARIYGKDAKKPTNGGNGGSGGQGGPPGSIEINGLGNSQNIHKINNQGPMGEVGRGGSGGKETHNGRQLQIRYGCLKQWLHRYYEILPWIEGAKFPAAASGQPGENYRKYKEMIMMANSNLAINHYKNYLRENLFKNIKEFHLRTLITKLENDDQIKTKYDTIGFVNELEGLENQFLELRDKIDFVPFYKSLLERIEKFALTQNNLDSKKVLSYVYTAALTKLFTLKNKRKGKTVVNLYQYLHTIESNVKDVRDTQYLQIVQGYENDYKNTLLSKIQEANNFIQNKIEPEIDKLWEDSDSQIKFMISEIQDKVKETKTELVTLHEQKSKMFNIMTMRGLLLPLKLAATGLSFFGPIGAMAGAAVTATTSVAEGMLVDTTSGLGLGRIYSLDPNLKLMSRVTEVLNNKPKLLAEKLNEVVTNLEKYKDDISVTQGEKIEISQKIGEYKSKIDEVKNRPAKSISQIEQRQKDAVKIEKDLNEFINSRKELVESEKKKLDDIKSTEKDAQKLKKELKLEKSLRRINHVQSVLNGVEVIFSFVKKIENDKGVIANLNKQMSQYTNELKTLEKLEDQVYTTILPDFRQIEDTVNTIKASLEGSSHTKLDYTKWTVRKTLKDVKLLLQKFTHKMSFELQSNIQRCIDKIDEGFSILIDIYDRIDTYSDSVKQAEYIAHIVSTPMNDVQVTDSKLRDAVIDLRGIIHSNIIFEKYGIALHAFKQHYFPFAAHVLQKFQLPTGMKLKDTENLRSSIINKIREMMNHIDESQATIGEYSKYIHESNIFNSNTTGSQPFYIWEHETIKGEVQKLFNGSEILVKADISKGLYYNSVKYTDIGINLRTKNESLQNDLISVLKNFVLTMTMVGNNYYRCVERFYYLSFDDDITISYTLNQDESKRWINPNEVYSAISRSHAFLSPYGMWSIKLKAINNLVKFNDLKPFANETISLELIGRGDYIEEAPEFNFDICNEYLDSFYNVENIAKHL